MLPSVFFVAHLYFPLATFFIARYSVMSSSWTQFSGLLVDEDITYVLRQLDIRV